MMESNKGVSGGLTLAQIAEQDRAREIWHSRQQQRNQQHRRVKQFITAKSRKGRGA